VLEMSVDESLEFFKDEKDILQKIKPSAMWVGLCKLGQSSDTLSGGEAQRENSLPFGERKGAGTYPVHFR